MGKASRSVQPLLMTPGAWALQALGASVLPRPGSSAPCRRHCLAPASGRPAWRGSLCPQPPLHLAKGYVHLRGHAC